MSVVATYMQESDQGQVETSVCIFGGLCFALDVPPFRTLVTLHLCAFTLYLTGWLCDSKTKTKQNICYNPPALGVYHTQGEAT